MHGPSNHGMVSAESAAPERVAQHGDARVPSGHTVFGNECPAGVRLDTERAEEIVGHQGADHSIMSSACA